jgi:hypothetical protein
VRPGMVRLRRGGDGVARSRRPRMLYPADGNGGAGLWRGAPNSGGVAASDRGTLGPGPVGRSDTGRLYGAA